MRQIEERQPAEERESTERQETHGYHARMAANRLECQGRDVEAGNHAARKHLSAAAAVHANHPLRWAEVEHQPQFAFRNQPVAGVIRVRVACPESGDESGVLSPRPSQPQFPGEAVGRPAKNLRSRKE
jgi:hypothetical protein